VPAVPDAPTTTIEQIDGLRTAVLREPATGSEARVVLDVGANVHRFRTRVGGREVDVLASAPDAATLRERPTRFGSAPLFPYPGRIEGGRFTFREREIQLTTGPDGNAIHGFARARPFALRGQGPGSVVAELSSEGVPPQEWPFPCRLTLTISLEGGALRVASQVENTGGEPMPFGLGFHPYFPASPEHEVWVEADERWEQAGQGLPTGQIEPLGPDGGLRRARALREIPPQIKMPEGDVRNLLFRRRQGGIRAGVRDPRGGYEVELTCSDGFGAMVFFTPVQPPVVSLEPHTCLPNAFNLSSRDLPAGTIELGPGQSWQGWWELRVTPLHPP
jgi:aldose 1-epimerase